MTVQFASFEALQDVCKYHAATRFVWPDEGEFVNGGFVFNKDHEGEYESLIIDATTACLLVKVHEHLSEENQIKFRKRIAEGRGWFGQMVDFAWGRVENKNGAA